MITKPASTITGRVIDLKRVRRSVNGNPTWEVKIAMTSIDGTPTAVTEEVTLRTATDRMIGYAIDNSEYAKNDTVFTLNANRIISAKIEAI